MPLQWSERYNCHAASIGHVGQLTVSWSTDRQRPGYHVTVFGARLKEMSPDADHGKARAVALARKLLAEAIAALAA